MRITRLGVVCVAAALQAACLSTTVSTEAQELAQLQQDKARLNRVYASVEASLLENQRSDAAMQYARQQLAELQLARLKTCTSPASPNTQLRLQYAKCQVPIPSHFERLGQIATMAKSALPIQRQDCQNRQ